MTKAIRVTKRQHFGALRDTTVGKTYPVVAETAQGERCPDGVRNSTDSVALSFKDDVGDLATVLLTSDPQAHSWEVVE